MKSALKNHATTAQLTLPLHIKNVPRKTILEHLRFIEERLGHDNVHVTKLQACAQILADYHNHRSCVEHKAMDICTREAGNELTERDEDILTDMRLWGESRDNLKVDTKVFTTPEHLDTPKQRRRWITHTAMFNEFCHAHELWTSVTCQLPTISILREALRYNSATCLDIAWYYGHFALDALSFVAWDSKGHKKALTTLPTGSSIAVPIAQAFSLALVQIAQRACRPLASVQVDVYIDNFRFASTRIAIDQLVIAFANTLALAQVQLNDTPHQPVPTYEFLGIAWEHYGTGGTQGHLGSTAIATKSKTKLAVWQQRVASGRENLTLREVVQIFGILQYAAMVHLADRFDYYYLFKFLRKRAAARTKLDGPSEIWSDAYVALLRWLAQAITAEPYIVGRGTPPDQLLFVDAGPRGWAGIFVGPEQPLKITCGVWGRTANLFIAVREALALQWALRALNKSLGYQLFVRAYVDNTTVLHSWTRRRSTHFLVNQVMSWTAQLRRCIHSVAYISTKVNPADPLSRNAISPAALCETERRLGIACSSSIVQSLSPSYMATLHGQISHDPQQGSTNQDPQQGSTNQDPQLGSTNHDPQLGSTKHYPHRGSTNHSHQQGNTLDWHQCIATHPSNDRFVNPTSGEGTPTTGLQATRESTTNPRRELPETGGSN